MYGPMKDELSAKIAALKEEGLYKAEAPLTSPQSGKKIGRASCRERV